MGIASLILGIISVIIGIVPFCGIIALLPAIVGLILGIIDVSKKSKTKEKKGISIAGLIMSAVAIVFIAFWVVVASGMEVETNSNFTNEYLQNKQIEEQIKQEQKEEQQRKEQEAQEKTRQEEQAKKEQEEKEKAEAEKLAIQTYKDNCQSFEYKEIARNPDNYKGNLVVFTGEVVQVMEGYLNNVSLRINVTKGDYNLWDDTVYCTYKYGDNESKILEDDIVRFYGECKGSTSYTSIFGQKITLPEVAIKYIELIEE